MTIEITVWTILRVIWGAFGFIGLFTVIIAWPKVRAEYRRKKRLRQMVRGAIRSQPFKPPPEVYKARKTKPRGRGPIGS